MVGCVLGPSMLLSVAFYRIDYRIKILNIVSIIDSKFRGVRSCIGGIVIRTLRLLDAFVDSASY